MARTKDRTLKLLNVNGVMVEVTTISGLAKIVGKSRDSILRYERNDIFPIAPIMVGNIRYYPISLAKKLVPLVERLPGHKKPDAELIVEITNVFNEERNKLCRQKQ